MGEKLRTIYDLVEMKAGYKGRLKLAQRAGMSREKAVACEEDHDVIEAIKMLASEILGKNINDLLTQKGRDFAPPLRNRNLSL